MILEINSQIENLLIILLGSFEIHNFQNFVSKRDLEESIKTLNYVLYWTFALINFYSKLKTFLRRERKERRMN